MREFVANDSRILKNWNCEDCEVQCLCLHAKSKVEIIVCTFNHETSVLAALHSISEQTMEKSEISVFLHDDGSHDETVLRAERFLSEQHLKYTIVSRQSNQFAEKKFSFFFEAVFASVSKYVAFLDGDDLWVDAGKLRAQVHELEAHPFASICHTSFRVSLQGRLEDSIQPDASLAEEDLTSPRFLRRENFIGTATALLRTASIPSKPGNWDLTQFPVGDYPLWLLSTRNELSEIIFLRRVTAQYNIHNSNYWASGNLFSRLRRNRALQKFLSSQLGEKVGSSNILFAIRVTFRRLLR